MAKKKKMIGGDWFPHCEETEWLLHRTSYGAFQDEPPKGMPTHYYVRHQRDPQPGGDATPPPVLYTLTEAGMVAKEAAQARRELSSAPKE